MIDKRLILRTLVRIFLVSAIGVLEMASRDMAVLALEKKKDPKEGKKGTIIGILTGKGENFIEVQAAGEEKGRKYVPQWIGRAPAEGGGFDKNTLKAMRALTVGSRIEIEWLFEERLRVLKIKVLKAAAKEKDKENK